MTKEVRVTLIFDPFSIIPDKKDHISGLKAELTTFAEINDLLRRDPSLETIAQRTYVISKSSIEHFRIYLDVRGIKVKTVTPRVVIGEHLDCQPPSWLTDERILELDLLNYPKPESIVDESWEATVATWLVPGIEDALTLDQWLRIVSASEDRFRSNYGSCPVSVWIQNQFFALVSASEENQVRDFSNSLLAELTRAKSPVEFAKTWLRRNAILPLTNPAIDNPLRIPVGDVEGMSVGERQLAARLPLIFPLPDLIQKDISELYRHTLRKLRLNERHRLSEAIGCLNAIWPGVAEEIQTWLDVYPKGLSQVAADHLKRLPGFDSNELIRRLVDRYSPPTTLPPWPGLTDKFESWVQSYSKYIRSCFLRRDFNENEDPANGFGRWLKDHSTVSFEHYKYSYFRVAQSVQQALANERIVFLVMVDALPIHQVEDLIGFMSDNLGDSPTNSSCIFVPLPTLSEVCKEAVLTGKLPSECRGDLKQQLQKRFSLSEDEIHLAGNWKDADRFQTNSAIRLVVYRENRLDDQLHNLASYGAMVEASKEVFLHLSRLLKRWSDDVRCISQKPPIIFITADHGFTYGPTPGNETVGNYSLDGTHRCVGVNGPVNLADSMDKSITIIDKDVFRLKQNYLAASGRYFGRGTMSGWAMAHGGLLPEEVIVPFVEWYGNEELIPWPSICLGEFGHVDRDHFCFNVSITNPRNIPTLACTFRFNLTGEDECQTEEIPAISVGASQDFEVRLPFRGGQNIESIPITVTIRSRLRKTGELIESCDEFLVPRKKRLVEKTIDQDDFENMF